MYEHIWPIYFHIIMHSKVNKFFLWQPTSVLVSCPASPRMCEKEGLVFWTTFLVTAPQSESSNQIAEHVIICDDVIKHEI